MGRPAVSVPTWLRWTMAGAIALFITVVPIVRYRWVYRHSKRLREITPGLVYRSGWLSAPGFEEAIRTLKIHTVINLMEDEEDPVLFKSYFFGGGIRESELCKQLRVRYVLLKPDLLLPNQVPAEQPKAIAAFLRLMDDPKTYPVLWHCRAGLHRTGVFTAVYRMEYQGWTPLQAWQEMKANGFGEYNCFADNPYITQYVLTYKPRADQAASRDTDGASRVASAPGDSGR
jgi:tyrosine-protein phosphatase SIW14